MASRGFCVRAGTAGLASIGVGLVGLATALSSAAVTPIPVTAAAATASPSPSPSPTAFIPGTGGGRDHDHEHQPDNQLLDNDESGHDTDGHELNAERAVDSHLEPATDVLRAQDGERPGGAGAGGSQ